MHNTKHLPSHYGWSLVCYVPDTVYCCSSYVFVDNISHNWKIIIEKSVPNCNKLLKILSGSGLKPLVIGVWKMFNSKWGFTVKFFYHKLASWKGGHVHPKEFLVALASFLAQIRNISAYSELDSILNVLLTSFESRIVTTLTATLYNITASKQVNSSYHNKK